MRTRLVLLTVVCVLLLGVGIVAQAQDVPEVTLTAWSHDQLYLDFFAARLPAFQELHPEVKIIFNGVFDLASADQRPECDCGRRVAAGYARH